jgi:hypothetical protein
MTTLDNVLQVIDTLNQDDKQAIVRHIEATSKLTPSIETLRQKREDILSLAEQYGVYNVRVFGSVARNEATPNSDIDLLVSVKPHTSIHKLAGLWSHLKDLLAHEVDLVTEDGLRPEMREAVLKESVVL